MDGRDWYLVQCKPGETQRAFEHLQNQQYDCYLPIIRVAKIRKGKRVTLDEPLFPGYLFIHLDQLTDDWQPIRSTRGVTRLVSFGGLPLAIDSALIAALKTRCETKTTLCSLQKGEKVRITEGPFRELEAMFESFDGDERVVLLLNLLQHQQRLVVPVSSIHKVMF
ncbi:hypothetical protein LH51_01240 [Nitrincola sp. A-D6]|uniref:transcription/translation regulatory transformer protein RfaH n=1 Tax=Nitrincola sp. A-D6 TaxID=1545442 RepID=UPI00051F88FA|nr:transcription/translation regulatory transformer protein RfaH [Nitrincola sp. A-D6]KGK43285.1 hypothetical protein LH51_01240 [Nitrincola sp. A-D6]